MARLREREMKKPHEETWSYVYGNPPTLKLEPDDGDGIIIAGFYCNEREEADQEKARSRLAAQAPAMARLLLVMEWIDIGGGDDGCPSCGRWKHKGHAPDCGLVTVLRAAGVMP